MLENRQTILDMQKKMFFKNSKIVDRGVTYKNAKFISNLNSTVYFLTFSFLHAPKMLGKGGGGATAWGQAPPCHPTHSPVRSYVSIVFP